MSFISRIQGLVPGNDPRRRRELELRRSGVVSPARDALATATNQARTGAQIAATSASDAGVTPALAQRLAGQQETASMSDAQDRYATSRAAERIGAENELAADRERKRAMIAGMITNAPETISKAVTGYKKMFGARGTDKSAEDGSAIGEQKDKDQAIAQFATDNPSQVLGAAAGAAGTAIGGPAGGMLAAALGRGLGSAVSPAATNAPVIQGAQTTNIPIMAQTAAEDSGLAIRQDAPPPAVAPVIPVAESPTEAQVAALPGADSVQVPTGESVAAEMQGRIDRVLAEQAGPRGTVTIGAQPETQAAPVEAPAIHDPYEAPAAPAPGAPGSVPERPASPEMIALTRRALPPNASEEDVQRFARGLTPSNLSDRMREMWKAGGR